MNKTKTLLVSVVVAVAVISSVSVFSLNNDTTTPKAVLNQETQDSVSIDEKETIESTTTPTREPVPHYGDSSEESISGYIPVELSDMPLLNQVVNMTAVVQNTSFDTNIDVVFYLRDGWEFVNVPESEIKTVYGFDNKTIYKAYDKLTVGVDEYQTFTKQVKPTVEGKTRISVGVPFFDIATSLNLFIGENRTTTIEQYWEENPDEAPWNNIPEREPCVYEDCEPVPNLNNTSTGTTSYEPTPEEEELMEEYWDRYNNTSSEPGASGAVVQLKFMDL